MQKIKRLIALTAVAVMALLTTSAGKGPATLPVTLQWDAPPDYIPAHYTLYVNGQARVDLGPQYTSWTDHIGYVGAYEFYVTAWRDDSEIPVFGISVLGFTESGPSNTVGIVVQKVKGKLTIVGVY
jgi:hypothetical protein